MRPRCGARRPRCSSLRPRDGRSGWLDRALAGRAVEAPARTRRARDEAGTPRQGRARRSIPTGGPERVVLACCPTPCSRHNAPSRADFVASARGRRRARRRERGRDRLRRRSRRTRCRSPRRSARALPLFSRAASANGAKPRPSRSWRSTRAAGRVPVDGGGPPRRGARALGRRARRHPDAGDGHGRLRDARCGAPRAASPRLKVTSIVGDALLARGLGGIHAVGRAAEVAPRLLLLEYKPARAQPAGGAGREGSRLRHRRPRAQAARRHGRG